MKLQKPIRLKSGAYVIRLRLNGQNIPVYGQTEAECRRNATAIKADHQTGRVVQSACPLTVAQAIDAYIKAHPRLSPSTIRGYECIRDNVFTEAKDLKLTSVKWQGVIDRDKHAAKTVKNAWGLIKSVFVFHGLTPPNVTLPAQVKKERPFLDQTQITTFLKAVEGKKVELAALLGLHSLRRSEIVDVEWSDIDLEHNLIHVRGAAVFDKDGVLVHKKENKNISSTRDVPIMIPRLKELLKQGGEGYVVPRNPDSIYKDINAICRKNGLPEIGVHGLRHSFVSLAYHLGWSEIATMRVAGYADYATMRRIYTHLSEADKQRDIDSMTNFYS